MINKGGILHFAGCKVKQGAAGQAYVSEAQATAGCEVRASAKTTFAVSKKSKKYL